MARKNRPEGTRRPNGASSVYLGKDGKWHGWVTVGIRDDGTPDRRHRQADTEKEVIRKVQQLERSRDAGTAGKPGRAWTVEEWLTHWVENIAAPTVRRNTLVGYRASVYGHLIPGVGAHRINKLQPEHLEKLYRNLQDKVGKNGKKLKPGTIHHAHRTVRVALAEAVRRGHITSNPAKIARAPRVPEEEIIPFTQEEANRILKTCQERRNGVRFVVALTLGLRKGEALGLQWRDIDFAKRTIQLRRSLQPVKWQHGCTNKKPCKHQQAGHCPQRHSGGVIPQELKSRAGKRTVGMPEPLVKALQEHRREQQREREHAANVWDEQGWVFATATGKPINPRTDHDQWKALLKAAEVRDARLHDARHTAATMLLVLGVQPRAVMDVMGWSHIGMTTRYQHMTSELTVAIADQIGNLYWSNTDEDDEDDGDDGGCSASPVAPR